MNCLGATDQARAAPYSPRAPVKPVEVVDTSPPERRARKALVEIRPIPPGLSRPFPPGAAHGCTAQPGTFSSVGPRTPRSRRQSPRRAAPRRQSPRRATPASPKCTLQGLLAPSQLEGSLLPDLPAFPVPSPSLVSGYPQFPQGTSRLLHFCAIVLSLFQQSPSMPGDNWRISLQNSDQYPWKSLEWRSVKSPILRIISPLSRNPVVEKSGTGR